MRIVNVTDTLVHHHYPSIHDLVTQDIKHEANRYRHINGDLHTSAEWRGVPIGQRHRPNEYIEDVVTRGWPEGMEKARKKLGAINIPPVPTARRVRVRKDFGDHLDIHRVYAGNLDRAWDASERQLGGKMVKSHVSIVVDIATSGSHDADDLMWRGAVVALLSDAFQASGRNVEITAVLASGRSFFDGSPKQFHCSIKVKTFDQPMTPEQVIAVTGFAGFYRTYGFRGYAASGDTENVRVASGYGPITRFDLSLLGAVGVPDNIVIPKDILSERAAKAFVDKVLSERDAA